MDPIAKKLSELGITLPDPAAPAANYIPYVVSGEMVYVSGQLPFDNGDIITGAVGTNIDIDQAVFAARMCAISLIAQVNAATKGNLSRVSRVVRLGGFVQCGPEFYDHPKVINGASDLMVEVFGDIGRHSRAAIGAPSLPLNAAVEVDGIFQISQ